MSRPAQAQQNVTILVGDFWFCNSSFEGGVCQTTINAGDTVVWDFSRAASQHTTTECGASCDSPSATHLWSSGTVSGGTFQFTFEQSGTFLYYCQVHPLQMRGRIVVQAAQPTATSPAGQTPAARATSTPAPSGGGLPTSGQGPPSGSSDWWLLAALASGGAGLIAIGASTLRRRGRA